MISSANVNYIPSAYNQRATADYLRQLLLQPGVCLELWSRYVGRDHEGVINQQAVTEVLTGHLRAVPRRPGDVRIAPYQLRETVAEALAGRRLSNQALHLFISAFQIRDEDAQQLWELWHGVPAARTVSGQEAVSPRVENAVVAALGQCRHLTLSMNEHIWIGADRRIDQYHITQVVEAGEDGLNRIPFICDLPSFDLQVGQGCHGIHSEPRGIGENLIAAEILLPRPLNRGETTSLEYWVVCTNEGRLSIKTERECRRAVRKRLENYEQRIEFHSESLPAMVNWAQWDGMDGDVIAREQVEVDSQHSVQRYLQSVERSVVGFYWAWPEDSL
jgi:hypothetical protein